MCECYQIGGPFIAEDPDCPEHGTEAQAREREQRSFADEMRQRVADAATVAELRELANQLLDRLS